MANQRGERKCSRRGVTGPSLIPSSSQQLGIPVGTCVSMAGVKQWAWDSDSQS